jgi:O-antigen ligase
MLLLFWLYSALLIPFSVIPYEAKISTLRFGCYVGVYWAAANLYSQFPRRRAVWMSLLSALIVVALYSLVQHKICPERVLWALRYTTAYTDRTGGLDRLSGTYICSNHIAHLFQMWLPFCLVFLFLPQLGWFWRIVCAYAVPVFVLLIYQTQSRAGILGLIASLGTLGLMLMLRKSRKMFLLALIIFPLLAAAAVGGLWAGSSMFRDRMQPVVKVLQSAKEGDWEKVASLDFRPKTWADSATLIQDHPWTGTGPGSYGQVFPEYRTRWGAVRTETVHPHNEYIELLAEYGLIGALLALWAVIALLVPLIRLIKTADRPYHALPAVALTAALAGSAVHGLFDFELRIFPNALMLSLLAGCAVAPLLQQRREKPTMEKEIFTTVHGEPSR